MCPAWERWYQLERKQWSLLRADLNQHKFKLRTAGEEPAFKNAILKLADCMLKQQWKCRSLNKGQGRVQNKAMLLISYEILKGLVSTNFQNKHPTDLGNIQSS